jgi:hypothetical protein
MYDPKASDTPHLRGVQPTWEDLAYATELIFALWERSGDYDRAIEVFSGVDTENKIEDQLGFLRKLSIIDGNDRLLPNGLWIAEQFDSGDQQSLVTTGPTVGAKETLTDGEQAVFKTLLFERNWLPMVATVNLVGSASFGDSETDQRAEAFQKRIDHLDKYQSVSSVNSWKKKVQAHLGWTADLGLVYVDEHGTYSLTGDGEELHNILADVYHPEWPSVTPG